MRKAWKKAVSVLLTLVLIFGVLPGMNVSAEDEGGQGSGNSVEITLDNGTYDDTYKNKYGTIQYSTNYRDNSTSAEWKEISELKASDNQGKSKYTIQGENVYIKITYAQGSTYKAAIPNGVEVKDGVPIEITGGHIEFTDTSAGGGSQGGNPPQPTGASINGVTLAPQTEVSTFTFKMPDTNVHFKGIFTQTSDEINTSATKVSSASFENGANAAPSGNLRLTVADSNEDTTNALAQVANAVSAEAVNLTLDQIVSKGNGTNWETPVTQFSQPVKMKLKVADYDTAAGYEVVREHNGNLTKLTTSVSEDGTLTFETNQFSTYFIVKTAKKADNGNAKTEKSSNTSSTTASSAAGSTDNAITAQSVSGEGVPAINIASATDQLLNLAKLSEDENKAVKAGNKTQFVLSASGMTPTKEEIALIQSVLGNNVIGQYLNLNLTLKISGREDRQITDLSAPMYITITIPQNLVNHDSSIERIYRIVRIHDGVATLIDGTYDAATNQFTFATDGFSTYALVYEDVNTTLTGRSPKTGDNSMWMVWTLILCAGCGALFAAGKRYRKNR